MKNIFTLLMVLVVAVSLSAASQAHLPVLKQETSKSIVSQTPGAVQMQSFQQQNMLKHITRAMAVPGEKIAPASMTMPMSNMQKVDAEPIVLQDGKLLVEPEYEIDEDTKKGEWYVVATAGGYTFRLCWYGDANDYSGTYTFDDISWNWTWGWYQAPDLYYEIYLSDVNMTISQKQISQYHSQIILDATLIDTEDRVFQLHIVHNAYAPKSTIETTLTNAKVSFGLGQYTLQGNDPNLDVQLTVNSSVVDGFYMDDSFDASSRIVYKGVEQKILQARLDIASTTFVNGAPGYGALLEFFNQDTILHTVMLQASLPDPLDTVQVTCTNLEVDDYSFASWGYVLVTGSNDLYDFMAMYPATVAEEGVYKNVSLTIADKITWIEAQAIAATLTLKEETDGWHAHIDAYGADYNWYEVDMSFVIPTPTQTVKVGFTKTANAVYNLGLPSMFQLLHEESHYEASVTLYNPQLGMNFTKDDVYMDYSGVYDCEEGRSVRIADINGTLLQRGDSTIIQASVIGFNAVQYDIELWYAAPIPTDTIEIEMPVEYEHALDYGYYTLKGYTPDSVWFISLSPITDQVAGTYVNDGLFGKFGEGDGRYDFFSYSTFIVENSLINYTVDKGEMVVSMGIDGKITAEAMVIAKNAKCFHIKMTAEYNTHMDYDEPSEAIDRTYTIDDEVFIEDQTQTNGYIYLSLTAADESDQAAFFFYVEEANPEIMIPPGMYAIDTSNDYGTVAANPGVQGTGLWPSYYARYDESGQFVVPVWLLVGGTVEVTIDENRDPHLEVNAVNTYGVPVHIVFDGTRTAVDHVTTTPVLVEKRLQDGQLYIIRQNKVYNALGARVQ